ncbi:MAG: Mut7-C RNAse domain-containing protein [Acidobacteriota bacterium]|nr:Mut7-C RNAse domain-containing protein [Acidobacteriota bacterium]
MAISCTNCGRQYDVTLFQFGKTINCACGERVGLENRIVLPPSTELRFFADVMAHRLVRWLRALGIDTVWEDRIPDAELVRRALSEHRWILTLDKRISEEWRVGNVLLLKSEDVFEQLEQVARHFSLKITHQIFKRCLVCNTLLRAASGEELDASDAPENVRANQRDFQFCPMCRKIYWQGSHTERMKKRLEKLFNQEIE